MQDQKGQTLIIAMFLMLFALGVGVSVSTTFFKNLQNTSQTDSASRALAVAEAAVEHVLLIPQSTLESYIASGTCGADCVLQIVGTDGIVANALVTLSYIGNSPSIYTVEASKDVTTEINLNSYSNDTSLSVCWDNPASGPLPSVTALHIYGTTGSYSVQNYAYNSAGSTSANGFSTASAGSGFTNCFTVAGQNTPVALRLRPIYNDVTLNIVPESGSTIPIQGILITSVGTVSDSTKRIQVIKSFSTLPTFFDYTLYQRTIDYPLSN